MTAGARNWGDEVAGAAAAAEQEWKRAVNWFNDRAVPEARRELVGLLRVGAKALGDLADALEGKPGSAGQGARPDAGQG